MRKVFKWIGVGVGGLLLAMVIAVGAVLVLFEWNWLKEPIVARASDATGREISIEGDIEGEFALDPRLRITGIRIANAQWAKDRAKDMASIQSLTFRIELLELLRGRMVLPELTIVGADVSLVKRRDGTANWNFGLSAAGATAEAVVPEERTEFPVIGTLVIDDSEVNYFDPSKDIAITVKISNVDAEGGKAQKVRVTGDGQYRNEKFDLALTAGRLLDLRKGDEPYPIDFRFSVGETMFEGKGTALRPLDFDGLDFDLRLAGPDLADLFPITNIPLPPTADYSLEGRLSRRGPQWSFKDFEGRVGNSDLRGSLAIDARRKVPFMEAAMASNRLDFDDLGGFFGAPPDRETPTKESGRVLPDMNINLERLHAMNMHVEFKGTEIVAPNMPISDLETVLVLQDGKLTLKPLEFGVAGGAIEGPLVLDGRKEVPVVETDLTLKGLSLKPFFEEFDMGDLTRGKLGGKIRLAGRGKSLADVLGSSDGRVTLAMVGGTIDPLIVELLGLDIAEALAVVVTPEKEKRPVRIRCMLGDMAAKDGVLTLNGFLIDSSDSNIWGEGSINLQHETLALRLHADPKDASLLSANAPIAVSGPFRNPNVAIDTLGTEGKGGLGEALGKIANPILALLPFVDLGLGEDTDCRGFGSGGGKPQPRSSPSDGLR